MEKTKYIDNVGKITVKSVAYHRNGICGNGFNVITFTQKDGNKNQNMVAVVFEEQGSCAVFDTDLLGKGNVNFGENSWRGDHYETTMRKIAEEFWTEDLQNQMEETEVKSTP